MRLQRNCVRLCLGFLICVFISVPFSRLTAETLKNPRMVFTGSNPRDINTADFNGDGKQDLAYLDGQFPSTLHILLGNGDNTFQHGQDAPLPQGINGVITIADVNGDGHPDILIGGGNQFAAELVTFLGVGDGTFSAPIVSQFATTSTQFAFNSFRFGVADFNGDGAPDLIVTDSGNELIFVLLGDKSGSFTLKQTIFDSSAPVQVITGDFNGDGHPDFLVRGGLGADVSVFIGNGDGTFQPGVSYSGPNHIGSVLLVDIDGDGHQDMVVGGFGNIISILHGNADGTFATTSSGNTTVPGVNFGLIAAKDFNGDGILDLAILSADGISILFGQGSLTFGDPVPYTIGPAQLAATALADFNQDGHLDFAATAPGGIALLQGNGDGTFQSMDTYLVPGIAQFVGFGVADFNGDHVPDIVAPISPSGARLLLGAGAGKFNLSPTILPTAPGSSSTLGNVFRSLLIPGNFNGDAATDLLFANSNTVLFGNGNGTFSSPIDLSATLPGISTAGTADFNHDGRNDILAFGQFQLSLHSLLSQPGNSFSDVPLTFPFPLATGGPTVFADFNHDGNIDAIFGSFPNLQPLLGNGDGTFTLGTPTSIIIPGAVPTSLNELAAADIDGDGNVDIVAVMDDAPNAEIFYGKGDGTFESPVALPLSRFYFQIAIADMNGDGKPDLVLADNTIISVVHNNGGRSFGPEVHYLAGTVETMVVQDLNGDGLPDIVVGSGSDTVSVLLNQAGNSTLSGTMAVSVEPSALGQPLGITLAVTPATATGTVTFSVDNLPFATVPITSGLATSTLVNTSNLTLGTHNLTALYGGNNSFTPATFSLPHKIVPLIHPTSISVTASPNSLLVSQTVHFAISVTSVGPTPSGTVSFHDGPLTIGSATLDPSTGTGVFNTALLGPGNHTITAQYLGDENSAPATSTPISLVITAFSTSTTLAGLPSTPQVGSTIALSATVASGSGSPSGSVSFFDAAQLIGTQELDSSGVGVLVTTLSTSGAHSFTASYNANGPFTSSTSAAQNLTLAGSSTSASSLKISLLPDSMGNRLLLTATVQPALSSGQSVSFFSDNFLLGVAPITANGMATLNVAGVFPGTHYFSVVFAGNNSVTASAVTNMFGAPISDAPEFALRLSAANTTLAPSQSAHLQISVDPIHGFAGPVALACSSAASVSCTFHPASISTGSASQLIVTVLPAGSSLAAFHLNRQFLFPGMALALAFSFLVTWNAQKRRLAWAMLGLACMAAAVGCAGRTTSANPVAVTVTATSSQAGVTISHSTNLLVTITK
jgi:hypothetical protein